MPKRSSKPGDVNSLAAAIVGEATNEGRDALSVPAERDPLSVAPEKDPLAVELGRRGGLKGGKARAAALPPEERKRIAEQAARKRWAERVK